MKVLSCRRHESVKIGQEITILVVDTSVDAVRLAIDAPKNAAIEAREKFETFQGGLLRGEEAKRRPAAAMTLAQRLRTAIESSGQSAERLAMQMQLPQEALEDFLKRSHETPLSVAQRIASHFKLQLTGPDDEEAK